VHGEADLVDDLAQTTDRQAGRRTTILDAGCGTGRVAIELARRGHTTTGIDRDADLVATARAKAPELTWVEADLVATSAHVAAASIDVAVLAGNVMIFLDPGTEGAVLASVAETLRPGGLVVIGFQVRAGGYGPVGLDEAAADAGFDILHRWSTWARDPWAPEGDYQVSVHRRPHEAHSTPHL